MKRGEWRTFEKLEIIKIWVICSSIGRYEKDEKYIRDIRERLELRVKEINNNKNIRGKNLDVTKIIKEEKR